MNLAATQKGGLSQRMTARTHRQDRRWVDAHRRERFSDARPEHALNQMFDKCSAWYNPTVWGRMPRDFLEP